MPRARLRSVPVPATFLPHHFEEQETMEPAAIVTFVVIAGIVWGGALLIATTAIRKESGKTRDV